MGKVCSFAKHEKIDLGVVSTVHFVDFIVFVKQMHNRTFVSQK
jgi:hypothetical protein